MLKKDIEKLMELNNDDYQNRRGNYPQSNIPDGISVTQGTKAICVVATFKNTSEDIAKRWLERTIKGLGLSLKDNEINIKTYQDGDYHNDWVCSEFCINL